MGNRAEEREKACKCCGKQFDTPTGEWAYKKYKGQGWIWFCSWKCMRQWERVHEISKIERRERILQALADGLSVKATSILLDEDPAKVSYWKKRMTKENV